MRRYIGINVRIIDISSSIGSKGKPNKNILWTLERIEICFKLAITELINQNASMLPE